MLCRSDVTTKKSLSALFRYILTNCTGLEKQAGLKRSADQGDKLSPILFFLYLISFFKIKMVSWGVKLVFWGVLGFIKSYSKYVRRQFTGLWKDLFSLCFRNVFSKLFHNSLSCPFLSAANVDLMCVHLGQGLMWSYPVLLRISQMCMTSKRHMNRCTTTWSARTRNCIPFPHTTSHTSLHSHILGAR